MLVIDDARIASNVSYRTLVEALRQGITHDTTTPPRGLFEMAGGTKVLVAMMCWNDQHIVTKILTVFTENNAKGLPSTAGCLAIFDARTGAMTAILAAGELTLRRTAAASALAADCLALPSPRTLLVVGTGNLAPHMAQAHCTVRSYERVLIWGRTTARAEQTAQSLRNLGLPAIVATDLREAQSEADVIATCTTSHEPLVLGRIVKRGVHVSMVGGYTPQMRESDSDLIEGAAVWADCSAGVVETAGDITIPVSEGRFNPLAIRGDLIDLVRGPRAATDLSETTVFKSVGFAALDLIAATCAIESCRGG